MMPNTTESELATLLLLLARSTNLTPQCPLAIFANNLLSTVERESVNNEDIKETLANQFTTLLEKQKVLESQIEVISIARDKLQGELSRIESHLHNLCNDLNNVIIQRDMCKLGINALLLEPDMIQNTNVANEENINSEVAQCNSTDALKEVVQSINISHSVALETQKQNMKSQKELENLSNNNISNINNSTSSNDANQAIHANINNCLTANDVKDREGLLLTESGMQDDNTSEIESSLQSSWSSTLTEIKEVEENIHGKVDNSSNININKCNENDHNDDQDVRHLITLHHEGINSTNTREQCKKDYKEHNEVKWTTRRQAKQSTLVDCDDDKKKINNAMSKDSNNSKNRNNNSNTISKKNIINTTEQDNVEFSVCCVDDKEKSLTDSFTGKNSNEQTLEYVTSSEKEKEATNQHFQHFQNKAIQETTAVKESKQLEYTELQEHIRDVPSGENSYGEKVYSKLLFALKTSGISEVALVQALSSFEQWAFVEYSRWADGYATRDHGDEERVGKRDSTTHLTEEKVYKSKMVEVLESIAHHLLRMQPNIQLLELRIIKHVFTASPINDAKACLNIARILNDLIKERHIIIVLTQLLNSINDDVKSAALECLLPFVCLSHSVLRATMSSEVCGRAREIFVQSDGLKYLLHIVEFNTSVTVLYRALIFLWGLLSKDDERKSAREVAQTSDDKISTHNNINNSNKDNNESRNVAQETDPKRKFKEAKIEDMQSKKFELGTLANDACGYDEFDANKAHNRKCEHDDCSNNDHVEFNNYTECVQEVYSNKLSEIGDNNRKNEKGLTKSNSSEINSFCTSGSYIHRVIRELGGLQAVIPLLYTDTLVLLENVCMVIGYMTRDEENKTEMRECGGLEKLTATLHHPSLSIKAKIAGAIWNCSSNATNRTHLRHIGTISSLLQLLYVDSVDFKNRCKFKGIFMSSVNGDVKTNKLINKNIHEVLSSEGMTNSWSSGNNNKNNENSNNDDGISSSDESQTCIRAIGFSESNVYTNGERKNSNIDYITNDKAICDPVADNAVSTLDVKNTCIYDDANNIYKSSSAFSCTDKNNTDAMCLRDRQSGRRKVCWTAEEREEIEFVRENVTGALWNISLDVENKLSIVKYNGVIDLLTLLTESTKLTVIENASGTLWNCSALYEARRIIDECDGVFIMLSYLYKYMLQQNLEEEDRCYHSGENNVNHVGKKFMSKNLRAYSLQKETRCSDDNNAKTSVCNQHHLEQQQQEQQQQQQHEEKENIYHDIAADAANDNKNSNLCNNKMITLKEIDNISEHEHSKSERRLDDKLTYFWHNDAPMPCNCKIAENILGILRNCAVIDTSKSALLEYNSIPIFIECLRIWAYNAVNHKRAGVFLSDNAIERITSILWILSISAESKHEIRKCGGLELLIEILMMSSPTEHQTKICPEKSILTNKNEEIMCDSIACKTEEAMQSSLSKRQWQEILNCISSFSTANNDNNSSDNLAKFTARLKAVPSAEPAITLYMSIREKIVGIIRNCSTLQESKEPLLKYHAVKCLVAVVLDCYSPWVIFANNEASHGKCSKLDFPSAQLKETVASAIWHLAKENKEVVRAEGGLELMCLFVAMPQETTLILEQATGALSSLTMNNIENRIALKEYDTLKSLMRRIVEYTLQHGKLYSQAKETELFTSKKAHKSSNSNNDIEKDSSVTVKNCANNIVANSIVTLRNCMINNNANVKECGKLSLQNNCAFLGALLELIKDEPAELTKELLLLLRYLCSIKEVSQHVAELHGSVIVSSVNSNKLSETTRRAIQYILKNLKRVDSERKSTVEEIMQELKKICL